MRTGQWYGLLNKIKINLAYSFQYINKISNISWDFNLYTHSCKHFQLIQINIMIMFIQKYNKYLFVYECTNDFK